MISEKTKIVADSSSDVLSLERLPFGNAPLKILTDSNEYVDNESLDVRGMVTDLASYKGRSSTSCPNVSDWINEFDNYEYIFCVTITSNLSGSYNTACLAQKQYTEQFPDRKVYVVNSLSTGPEMKLIIEKLVELIDIGYEFDTICSMIEEYRQKTGLLFVLQSMRNLANNGRVSHLAAKMAGILGIRALGKASDEGTLEMLDKCRGENKTADTIIATLKKLGYKNGKVRISHCFSDEFAEKVKTLIIKEFSPKDIELYSCRGLCSFYAESGGLLLGFEKAEL